MTDYLKTKTMRKSGFSLSEAIIAMLIFSVVGISTFTLISSANQSGQSGYYRQIGEEIGKETIEILQLLGYEELNGRQNTTIAGITIDYWSKVGNSGGINRPSIAVNFIRKVSLKPIENSENKGLLAEIHIKPDDVFVRSFDEIVDRTVIVKREAQIE